MSQLNQEGSVCQLPSGKMGDKKKVFESDECCSTEKSLKLVPPERPPHPPVRTKSRGHQKSPSKLLTAEKQKVGQASLVGISILDTDRSQSFTDITDKTEHVKETEKLCINSATSSPIKAPKPAPRTSREHLGGSNISLNSGIQDRESVNTDNSDLNIKVSKSSKCAKDPARKASFNPEDKMKGNIQKRDIWERRKTVPGHERELQVSSSVGVVQCKQSIEGSKGDKPTPPQKPDLAKRHLSIPKELENQQNFRCDKDSELNSVSSPPLEFSKDSVAENSKRINPSLITVTPSTTPVRSSSFNTATKCSSPSKPSVPVKKPDLRKDVSESKDSTTVTLRNTTLPGFTTSQSLPQPTIATPPPKPPRTHAHDDYLKVQTAFSLDLGAKPSDIQNLATARKSEPSLGASFRGGDFFKGTKSPSFKDKLSTMQQPNGSSSTPSSSPSRSNTKEGITMCNPPPSRPPPPRRRPASDDHPTGQSVLSHSLREHTKAHEGSSIVSFHSQKCLRKTLPNTHEPHSRHPNDKLPPEPKAVKSLQRLHLHKSFSSDYLYSSEYVSVKNEFDENDDSDSAKSSSSCGGQYAAVIDPDGYAVPNAFMHLPKKQSNSVGDENIGVVPKKRLTRIQRSSHKNVKILGNVITSIQDQTLNKVNKKTMIMVRQKINQAYADVNIAPERLPDRPDNDWEFVEHGPDTDELVIEPIVLKKRIEYCASVRRRSTKSIRRSKEYLGTIYPQLFEYCFIVGLRQLVDEVGYEPYVMHKFPENVSGNLSVPSFCFPDASVFKPGSVTSLSETYSFVMTSSDGSRVYGYCRRMQPKDTSLPEGVCIVSPVDAFNMYNTLHNEIEARRCVSFDLAAELIAASFGRPLPKPGKVCHIRTLDISGDMETIFLSRSTDSRLENVNYESPLHYLGTEKLVKVFSSMLMERRIILYSNNLSVLTQTVHALCALLYPFHWQHVYIPILPDEMLDAVCAPMPFIVGVLSCFLPRVQEMDLEEVLIVDLDKKMIVKSQGDESTILPKRIQKALKTAINMCKIDAEAHKSQWLMVTEAFLRMFIETIGHFNKHICTQQDGNKIFQKEGFILEVVSKERKEFLQWFTETQMFEVFIMNHLDNSDSRTSDLFMQRYTEYKESKEESGKQKGLGTKVKNLGKAIKTVLHAS